MSGNIIFQRKSLDIIMVPTQRGGHESHAQIGRCRAEDHGIMDAFQHNAGAHLKSAEDIVDQIPNRTFPSIE